MTAELEAFARQVHGWGANVTAIKAGTKRPLHKWKHWQSARQTDAEMKALPWVKAAAMGFVNGSGNFRNFDVDAEKDEDGRPLYEVPRAVLSMVLRAIGLPEDYQWAYASGSGAGWGFIIRCEEELPTHWQPDEKGVFTGIPSDGLEFHHLELRWNSGQTVFTGRHPVGPGYQWVRNEPPFIPPTPRSIEQIIQAFESVAILKQTTVSTVSTNGLWVPTANGNRPAYGQAALKEAIHQVSTSLPGNRNNLLFQQTAALAELVNGGMLDRQEVEQGMNGAALAAGLQNGEIEATISSAFKTTGNKVRQVELYEGDGVVETAVENSNQHVLSLRTVTIASLLAQDFAPLVFLVHGLIALGYLVVLAGRPKSGKSWLGLQLAMCIDTGRPFLGRHTRQSNVLLIALEDGERRVYQRAKDLGWVPSETAVLATKIARFDGPNGTPGPGLVQVEQAAAHYDLIVIDTLIATLSGHANENDNVQMAMIVNTLARIAHETNTAVVLVHHTGKGYSDDVFNTLRGASSIRGGYDVGLLLERKQGEQEAVLHAESRDIDVENMTLRQAANGAGWEYVGNSFEIEKIRAGKDTLKAMLELDPGAKGLTAKDIANHRSISESAVYRQLNRLLDDGHVEKVAMPSTSEGKEANLYYIVQEPQT